MGSGSCSVITLNPPAVQYKSYCGRWNYSSQPFVFLVCIVRGEGKRRRRERVSERERESFQSKWRKIGKCSRNVIHSALVSG